MESTLPPPASPAHALLTLWLDAGGAWHASVVLASGERRDFDSPFELARWTRGAVQSAPPHTGAQPGGLR